MRHQLSGMVHATCELTLHPRYMLTSCCCRVSKSLGAAHICCAVASRRRLSSEHCGVGGCCKSPRGPRERTLTNKPNLTNIRSRAMVRRQKRMANGVDATSQSGHRRSGPDMTQGLEPRGEGRMIWGSWLHSFTGCCAHLHSDVRDCAVGSVGGTASSEPCGVRRLCKSSRALHKRNSTNTLPSDNQTSNPLARHENIKDEWCGCKATIWTSRLWTLSSE